MEGFQLRERGVDAGDVGELGEVDLGVAAGVGDLGDEDDVGQRDGIADAEVSGRRQHLFQDLETAHDPVFIPACDGRIVSAELRAQAGENRRVVEGVDVGDDLVLQVAHVGAEVGVAREQRRLGARFVEIVDHRHRLTDAMAVDLEDGHAAGRMTCDVLGRGLFVLQKMDTHGAISHALEVQRDARAIGRRGTPVAVEDCFAHRLSVTHWSSSVWPMSSP